MLNPPVCVDLWLRTLTREESLANSLLSRIDPKNATADEIKEAFCRDIDAFSFEFQVHRISNGVKCLTIK